jgi:uncharacterized protein YggU (UPF0235/DUF167 family)
MDDISFAIKNHGDGAVLSLHFITNAQEALFPVIHNVMLKYVGTKVCSPVKDHKTNTEIIHLLSAPLKELPQDIGYSSSDARWANHLVVYHCWSRQMLPKIKKWCHEN